MFAVKSTRRIRLSVYSESEARSMTFEKDTIRCSTHAGHGHQYMLDLPEKLVNDKYSSLFWCRISDKGKSFVTLTIEMGGKKKILSTHTLYDDGIIRT
jgi:hypothetical protein